jgi:hypothetical protein
MAQFRGNSATRAQCYRTEPLPGRPVKANVDGRDGIPIADFTSSSLLHANSGFGIGLSGINMHQNLTISVEPNGIVVSLSARWLSAKKCHYNSLTIKAFNDYNELLGTLT